MTIHPWLHMQYKEQQRSSSVWGTVLSLLNTCCMGMCLGATLAFVVNGDHWADIVVSMSCFGLFACVALELHDE